MEDRIATIIRDWLNTEFKNPKAIPTPLINGIAAEIDKHRWEIYSYTREEYDLEDIETIAEADNIELTKKEKETILYRFRKCEDSNLQTLVEIVNEVVSEREKEKSQSSPLSMAEAKLNK